MYATLFQRTSWCTVLFVLAFCLHGNAQKSIVWKGGTPGKPTDWYCPTNWSTSSIPDEFSDVIIPDVSTSSFALPVIRYGNIEVNSVTILNQGILTLSKEATLIINGYSLGVLSQHIKGEGAIVFINAMTPESAKWIAKTR